MPQVPRAENVHSLSRPNTLAAASCALNVVVPSRATKQAPEMCQNRIFTCSRCGSVKDGKDGVVKHLEMKHLFWFQKDWTKQSLSFRSCVKSKKILKNKLLPVHGFWFSICVTLPSHLQEYLGMINHHNELRPPSISDSDTEVVAGIVLTGEFPNIFLGGKVPPRPQ